MKKSLEIIDEVNSLPILHKEQLCDEPNCDDFGTWNSWYGMHLCKKHLSEAIEIDAPSDDDEHENGKFIMDEVEMEKGY